MSPLQVIVVALTVCLNALDGFDVLAISFASPGIAAAWDINRAELGIVLSMEMLGMSAGSLLLGSLADRHGRRPVALACLALMLVGMTLVTTAHTILALCVWRVITGFGIGGMLATTNAIAAEFASPRRRSFCVALMGIGFPVGAVVGGFFSAILLRDHDWRVVFWLGAGATAALIPLVFMFVPESLPWLGQRRPAGALDKVNRTLRRMGRAALTVLPEPVDQRRKASLADIFAPGQTATTVMLTAAFFFHMTTFYFILKWIPKIVVDMGFAPSAAADVLVWANVGGAAGGVVLGVLSRRFGIKGMTVTAMLISTLMVIVFGHGQPDLAQLSIICAITGFFTDAGVIGLYALVARGFPTHVRGFGTGFVIGIGRGGTAIAPIIAGILFTAGYELLWVAIIMSVGSLVAAAALIKVRLLPESA